MAVVGLSSCVWAGSVEINSKNFPDAIFMEYVSSNFDTDSNGYLSDEEIKAVDEIFVRNKGISSLKGVEYFTALKELYCGENQLTTLDLSSNTALQHLDCASNQLTYLNVSNNPHLWDLYCNENQLTTLDLSNNTALYELSCSSNQLTTLDLSSNTALGRLICGGDQLTTLNIRQNIELVYLDCRSSPRLNTIDITGCPHLYDTGSWINFRHDDGVQIIDNTTLDIKPDSLADGTVGTKYNVSLSTSNLAYVKTWKTAGLPSWLILNSTTKTTSLTGTPTAAGSYTFTISCDIGRFSGSKTYTLTIRDLDIEISAQNFPDEHFRNLVSILFDKDKNGLLGYDEINAVTQIECPYCEIYSLKGIEYFTNLLLLLCDGNQLTDIDLSKNTQLRILRCEDNCLTSLTLGNNSALTELHCMGNKLTQLDITGCPNLSADKFTHDNSVNVIGGTSTVKPEFRTHSLVLSGQIGVNFFMYLPEISGIDYTKSYVEFDINGDKSNPPQYFDQTFKNSKGTYYGFRCYIKSIQMADKITATFHYGNNQTVTHEYSAKKYLDDSLAANISSEERALIEAIKDYGHYAQLYLSSIHTWELGRDYAAIDCENDYSAADIETVRKAVAGNAIVRDTGTASGVQRVGFSLSLDSDTNINLYIYPASGYTGAVSATLSGSNENLAVYQSNRNRYEVKISNISAHKLSDTYTVRVKAQKEFDVKVSAFSYVCDALNDSAASEAERKAVVSLYKYYVTTMNYRAATGQ